MELNPSVLNMNPAIIQSVEALFPTLYERPWRPKIKGSTVAADRKTIHVPTITVTVGRLTLLYPERYLDLATAANWDSLTPTDYTVAANRAGKDIYLYVTTSGRLVLSPNSTVPAGYTANNSRLVLQFHCLCANAGSFAQNATHPLTGFLLGDITPMSVADLIHRPSGICSPAGMVYEPKLDIWGDIYHQSGTGANTASAYGATITATRTYWAHADDLAAVGKRIFFDNEFSVFAKGSREQVNIAGSADPVTTGGYLNTVGEAILSENGAWGCFGEMYCWVDGGHIYRNDDAAYAGAWSWKATADSRGQQYTQGISGAVGLLAGGGWTNGALCGSRCRHANNARTAAGSYSGARGCARARGNS